MEHETLTILQLFGGIYLLLLALGAGRGRHEKSVLPQPWVRDILFRRRTLRPQLVRVDTEAEVRRRHRVPTRN